MNSSDQACESTTPTPASACLLDGNKPADEHAVLQELARLGIEHTTFHHAPVYTVAEAKALRGDLGGSHIKNLFLRNKKGQMWLITCHEDLQIDLKQLAEMLGAGRFSFARAERMMHYLGIIPGAVTPLAVINDSTDAVKVVLDQSILLDTVVNVHPLHNGATTSIAAQDLIKLLDARDHPAQILDMEPLRRKD